MDVTCCFVVLTFFKVMKKAEENVNIHLEKPLFFFPQYSFFYPLFSVNIDIFSFSLSEVLVKV